MKLEKKTNETSWFIHEEIKFKLKKVKSDLIIHVLIKNCNICLRLAMYDFILRCEKEKIIVNIDYSWNNHYGFIIKNGNERLIMGFISEIIIEWNVIDKINDINDEYISDEEWYEDD